MHYRYLELVMSSLSCFNASFIKPDKATCNEQDHGVDLKMASECFEIIRQIEHPSILDTVCAIFYFYSSHIITTLSL